MTVFPTSYCTIDEAWGDLRAKKSSKRVKQQDPVCELYNNDDVELVKFANEYYDKTRYQRNSKAQQHTFEEHEREAPTRNVHIKKNLPSKYVAKDQNCTLFEKQFEMKLPPMHEELMEEDFEVRGVGEESDLRDLRDSRDLRKETRGESRGYGDLRDSRDSRDLRDLRDLRDYSGVSEETRRRERYIDEERDEDYNYKSPFVTGEEVIRKSYSNLHILDVILYVVSGIILIFLLEQFVRIGMNLQN